MAKQQTAKQKLEEKNKQPKMPKGPMKGNKTSMPKMKGKKGC